VVCWIFGSLTGTGIIIADDNSLFTTEPQERAGKKGRRKRRSRKRMRRRGW
jgi:hypothetical protein